MISALRKTTGRTGRFLGEALGWREPNREHAAVVWGLVGGAVWFAVGLQGNPNWPEQAAAGLYLLATLAAICAIDARYGIIPNTLVMVLAIGGVVESALGGLDELLERGGEAGAAFVAVLVFRAVYRAWRGFDGLGLGDVKFVMAATLWVGIADIPALMLTAVLSACVSLLILRAEGYALNGKQAVPFGPHLSVGLWLVWVAGPLRIDF